MTYKNAFSTVTAINTCCYKGTLPYGRNVLNLYGIGRFEMEYRFLSPWCIIGEYSG